MKQIFWILQHATRSKAFTIFIKSKNFRHSFCYIFNIITKQKMLSIKYLAFARYIFKDN